MLASDNVPGPPHPASDQSVLHSARMDVLCTSSQIMKALHRPITRGHNDADTESAGACNMTR